LFSIVNDARIADENGEAIMDEISQFRGTMLRNERGIDNASSTAKKLTRFCAYNQTGRRFISNEVEVAEASEGYSEDCFSNLLPGSGMAVWIVPIRGLSASSFFVPVDLLYLDEMCAVLAMVESFPVSCVTSSIAKAASILVLPEHSVLIMGIDIGDQLMLCSPEDMQRYLMRVRTSFVESGPNLPARDQRVQLRLSEQQLQEVSEMEDLKTSPVPEPAKPAKVEERDPVPVTESRQVGEKSPKTSWFWKLLLNGPREQRQGVRTPLAGLVVYFFTGSAPIPHPVRDISATGLFVLTSERWYPGTFVRLTLTDKREPTAERTITLHAKVIRSTDDGVALKFLLQQKDRQLRGFSSTIDEQQVGVSVRELQDFVARFESDS
jgi:hypothetical protein